MAKLSPRAARIKDAMHAVFGERGLSRMADAAGISKQLLSFIVNDDRAVTDDVYRKVAAGLVKEGDRMKVVGLKADKLALQMLRELEE
jgi:hypothetical protein